MKTLKAICTTAILALALSIPVYAGDIGSPGFTAPGEIGTPGASATGDIGSPGAMSEGDMSTPGFADILMALLSVMP